MIFQDIVASSKEWMLSKVNRIVMWLVCTLWGCFQNSKRMSSITGHSYVPDHFPPLLRWLQRNQENEKVSLVAQWAGVDALCWDLWLYLRKKKISLSVLCTKWSNSCPYREAHNRLRVPVIEFYFLGRRRKKTISRGKGECEYFGVLCYILLFLVRPSSLTFYS